MEERDAFLFRADAGGLVDEANAGGSTTLQCGIEVVDGEANVMNPGAAFGDEPADG